MPNPRIMIVEDEAIVARDLKNRLLNLGYDVPQIVSSGEDAVAKAGEIKPDLILMDVMLKGEMDGIEAAEKIHASSDIPILYLTAYSDEETLQRAKITKPYAYILKPFDERELHIAIEMALYSHKMEMKLKEHEAVAFCNTKEYRRCSNCYRHKGLCDTYESCCPIFNLLEGGRSGREAFERGLQDYK